MKSYAALCVAALAASLVVGCGDSKKPAASNAPANPNLTTVPPTKPDYSSTAVGNGGSSVTPVGYIDQPPVTPAPPIDTKTRAAADPAPGAKYTVKKGDTLWSIATRAYSDGKQYKKIVAANPSIKGDKVGVGQTITIPN